MNTKDFDDIEIEDSSNWSSSKGKGKKEIIYEQYERCLKEGSKEMSEGGILNRVINGKVESVFVPNQNEIFENSVNMLWVSIIFEIEGKYKGEFSKSAEHYKKQYEKLNKDFNNVISEFKVDEKKGFNMLPKAMKLNHIYYKELYKLNMEKLKLCNLILNKENWFEERNA